MHTVSPEERKKLERLADDGNLEAVHFLERNLFFMERGTPFMKAWKLLSDSGGDAAMKRYNAFRRHRRWDPNDTRQGRRRDESETNAVKVESGDEKEEDEDAVQVETPMKCDPPTPTRPEPDAVEMNEKSPYFTGQNKAKKPSDFAQPQPKLASMYKSSTVNLTVNLGAPCNSRSKAYRKDSNEKDDSQARPPTTTQPEPTTTKPAQSTLPRSDSIRQSGTQNSYQAPAVSHPDYSKVLKINPLGRRKA